MRTCECCGTIFELRKCCGVEPELFYPGPNGYVGSIGYECPKCKARTLPHFSSIGSSIIAALRAWNNKELDSP